MCLYDLKEVCNNYQEDFAWMERSGNLCWGMGAADYIPCVNCGAEAWKHRLVTENEDG